MVYTCQFRLPKKYLEMVFLPLALDNYVVTTGKATRRSTKKNTQ